VVVRLPGSDRRGAPCSSTATSTWFSVTFRGGLRAWLVETAEKGIMWLRLRARGTAGHGSLLHDDNAVARLAAVGRHGREVVPATGHPPLRLRPLRLPPELDYAALFHGVDERVPIDALDFGTRVLERLLRTA
jgi:acetylornithine deacetylase/succinyl-diaminopimelate desuccinylase-like protein